MRVIVIGAGEVGYYLAERLSLEGHDIAVIEQDAERLHDMKRRLDVLTVHGSGSSPSALEAAGISSCSVLVAVTSTDETNLMACWMARQASAASTVVRLESEELRGPAGEELCAAMGVDIVIDPDSETVDEILELIEVPGMAEIARMVGGEVSVFGARVPDGAPIVGRSLKEVGRSHEPDWQFLFGVITRDGAAFVPRGDYHIEAGDFVRVICMEQAREELLELLGLHELTPRRVMVLGGGRTGQLVAAALAARGTHVTVVEGNEHRAKELAESLVGANVIHGDITDSSLLSEEGVGAADVVVALTGEDDANILACLFAKSEGARETIAVVHRLELLPLLPRVGVDIALSPRTASANAVLRAVRGGVDAVAIVLEGDAEVVQLEVAAGSPADGTALDELHLPKDVLVGAVVRDGAGQIARGRTRLLAGDRLVIFSLPRAIERVRQVFG
ncbi:MAG TPA: Trk system potassium transporter TrkA [Acidimicrobiia bacterium]|nr:Trk system potassium transporter TrkA [Acidimicrobiia bacterium]